MASGLVPGSDDHVLADVNCRLMDGTS
jgi:hypothetical protein